MQQQTPAYLAALSKVDPKLVEQPGVRMKGSSKRLKIARRSSRNGVRGMADHLF